MRKVIFTLVIFFIIIMPYSTVYAGTINSYEQDIIAYAQGTFEYKGSLYKIDTKYINMLIEYLESDGVDLTQRHRDRVYNEAVNYIETGVLNGYLVPVDGQAALVENDTEINANIENSSIGDYPGVSSGVNYQEKDDGIEAVTDTFVTNYKIDTDKSSNQTGQNITEISGESAVTEDEVKENEIRSTKKFSNSSSTGSDVKDANLPVKGEQDKAVASEDTADEGNISSNSNVSDDFIKDVLDMILDSDAMEQEPLKDVNANNKAKEKRVLTPVSDTTVSRKSDLIMDREISFFATYVVLGILGILLVAGIVNTIILSNRKKI